ncbi:MAG: hypothetical protein GY778_14725 [bacterium]|nr:hypothetical protein [bacterium]
MRSGSRCPRCGHHDDRAGLIEGRSTHADLLGEQR